MSFAFHVDDLTQADIYYLTTNLGRRRTDSLLSHYKPRSTYSNFDDQNPCYHIGAVVQLVEYRTRNQEVAGSTHTRSTASNLEQVANLLTYCVLRPTQPPTVSGTGNE